MKKSIPYILLFIILIVAGLPYLLSTRYGKPFLLRYLETKFKGNVSIEEVHLSWKGPQNFKNISFASPNLIATMQSIDSPTPFWKLQEIKQKVDIEGGTLSFPHYKAQIINANIKIENHEIQINASTPQGGTLKIQGNYTSKSAYHFTVEIKEIPTIALAQLAKIDILPAIFGSTININGQFSANRINAKVTSPHVSAKFNAAISEQAVTLSEPFQATVQISETLGKEIVKQISPKLLTDFSFKNPVILSVPAASMILSDSKIIANRAVLDLGQVNITAGGTLHSVLSIFKGLKKHTDIWFTPISFSLDGDQIQIDRFDTLLDHSVHLCLWGNVQNQKLDMILGIPSDTLKSFFDLLTLSPKYVLTIPIRGTIQNPKFDTGKAVAKIATMGAAKQIPTKAGKIFGNTLNIFTQHQEDEQIPPPKKPFPWES